MVNDMQWKKEEWRIIPSLPSREASTWGHIRLIPFIGTMPNGGTRLYSYPPTCGSWDAKCRRFVFQVGGQSYKVHRLVCEAFNGPPPSIDSVYMHLNEDARDTRPENLQWGTQKENLNAPKWLKYCSRAAKDRRNKSVKPKDHYFSEAYS